MNHYLSPLLILFLFFVNTVLFAQENTTRKDPAGWKKADKLYQKKGYMASATKYQMKHSAKDMTPKVMLRIANSYRLNGAFELAEYWYSKSINNATDEEDFLHYAEVLQIIGKCEDAIRWFEKYKKMTNARRTFITDCNDLYAFEDHFTVEVKNEKSLNTEFLDYSAVRYDGGVMFTSTRERTKMSKMTDTWTKSNFSDVFFTKQTAEGNYVEPMPVKGGVNKKYHDGVTSVSPSGTIMYFSRNNSRKKKKNGVLDLKIYSAVLVDGQWSSITELPFNDNDFASCHPSISSNGKWLYFSSNRPEGFGGMDIYVSENVDGVWQEPKNLGPTVNSEGNEIFPFISDDGALFFASNGHKGLGGLDIFFAKKSNTAGESTWSIRKNVGTPFNTSKDDFGFFANAEMTQGFLTSNRIGGKGGDDIYSWETTNNQGVKFDKAMKAIFKVVDANTNAEIPEAKMKIKTVSADGELVEGKTDVNGLLETTFQNGKNYKVMIEKEGYLPVESEVVTNEMEDGSILSFDLEKIKCIELFGTVINEKYNKAIPNASVTLMNKCTGEKMVVPSQADGSFEFCLDLGCDFEVIAEKPNFEGSETIVTTNEQPLNTAPREVKIELIPAEKMIVGNDNGNDNGNENNNAPTESAEVTNIKKHFLGDEKAMFEVGQVLTLKNIYYDFNRSNIRKDASVELDHVVVLMQLYPSMQITLSSHTDARGNDAYNQQLSEARAKSARQYIISKGIDAVRVKAEGFGESKLKNECDDGVNCSNEKHQFNRRTEVVINKVD
ncbi:MAG: OmpA family protein [Bacteroidota bacterium]